MLNYLIYQLFYYFFQEFSDRWSHEKSKLLCAFQRLLDKNKKLGGKKNVGLKEGFFDIKEYSILTRIEKEPTEDKNDIDYDDTMEQNNGDDSSDDIDMVQQDDDSNSIYCSICKETFSDPRLLAKHILMEHCARGIVVISSGIYIFSILIFLYNNNYVPQ